MIVESRPEYAVVQLYAGVEEKFPVRVGGSVRCGEEEVRGQSPNRAHMALERRRRATRSKG